MPDAFYFKQIKPARFKDKELKRLLRNAVFRVGRRALRDYRRTTKTWDREVKFLLVTSVVAPGPTVIVGTDDRIYRFIDEGTDVRYATMDPAYVPKTVPGVLNSFPGGGSYYLDVSNPRPGIEARGFSVMIQRKYNTMFPREMEKAMREAARVSGHGA